MIVMKFGGTSLQDSAAIDRVAEIVKSKLGLQPVVVVSAMARVTDSLLGIAAAANERRFEDAARMITGLAERHLKVARELLGPARERESVETIIRSHLDELLGLARSVATLGELTPRSQDAISSFGERLSSLVVAAAFRCKGLPAELVDSRELLVTNSNFNAATPDMAETEKRVQQRLMPVIAEARIPVAQGFIGSTPEGITTTIGRGGSDYSAAIIGAALGAGAIEIWTDVDGLMTADPRIVSSAKRIRVVSFDEAAELSYFGAKVLHPSTVLPAIERRIPVHIFNSNNPSCEGTLITAEPRRSLNTIKSIAVKRGVTIINVASTQMIMAHGFLRTIFEVFDRHQTSIDVVTTSETSVSMTLDNTDRLESILQELRRIGEVNVDPSKAIVCVVGDNLKFTPGVAARLFRALGDINVNMISQGASVINLTFVINDKEIERAIGLLHADFFRECDPAVFA